MHRRVTMRSVAIVGFVTTMVLIAGCAPAPELEEEGGTVESGMSGGDVCNVIDSAGQTLYAGAVTMLTGAAICEGYVLAAAPATAGGTAVLGTPVCAAAGITGALSGLGALLFGAVYHLTCASGVSADVQVVATPGSVAAPMPPDPNTGCGDHQFEHNPKHPHMPATGPERGANFISYAPPRGAYPDLANCSVVSPTLLRCGMNIAGQAMSFACRRHLPGGKGKADGEVCKFHCYLE